MSRGSSSLLAAAISLPVAVATLSGAATAQSSGAGPGTWADALEDVARRHSLRIVSFVPRYPVPPFEEPDPKGGAAQAVSAVAASAYGVAIRVAPDAWTIAPQCTPDEPPAVLLARILEGAASGPALTDMLLIPFSLREQAAEPSRLLFSKLPRETRADMALGEEMRREADAISLWPGGGITVNYRGGSVVRVGDVFYYARMRGKPSAEKQHRPMGEKYQGLDEIDSLLANEAERGARDSWKDWMTPITVSKSLRTLEEVVTALNAAGLPKRVGLEKAVSDYGVVVTLGTYAAGELLWLVRDASCLAIEEGADAVTVGWDRSCMDRLWQIPNDWQQRKYWEMVFHPFLSSDYLQDLAKPFTLEDFMQFRVIPWPEATAEQRAFVLRLLAEHGEHPRPEQEPYLVLFLSPRADLFLWREGRLVGGLGADGHLAQPEVELPRY